MSLKIYRDREQMGMAAALYGASKIRDAIACRGCANLILATGASQFTMLTELVRQPDLDWGKVTIFHLDEYVGLPESHPASFRKYIRERVVEHLPMPPAAVHYVDGSAADPYKICRELGKTLAQHPIDVCFIGIGENGHIAFNDPPADFDTEEAYLVVDLDETCRHQQLGEGWFSTLEDVPKRAISMSVRQILKSRTIVNTVPDGRKAYAMKVTMEGELSPMHPASVVRIHPDCVTFTDLDAASELHPLTRKFCLQ